MIIQSYYMKKGEVTIDVYLPCVTVNDGKRRIIDGVLSYAVVCTNKQETSYRVMHDGDYYYHGVRTADNVAIAVRDMIDSLT